MLVSEIIIAACVHDAFVRPYLGDSLAVVLVYLAIRAVMPLGVASAVALASTVAVVIEFGQRFGLLAALGLERYALARVVLGTGYDSRDFVAYGAGAIAIVIAEVVRRRAR